MTPHQFIAKWKKADLSERSAYQQHFLDLCELLAQPKPADVDPNGSWYTFERGVVKNDGGKGWADVWLQGKFGWEYKGKHKDLKAAYQQLLKYREALENPPLLVVCDLNRFEVHTNFTGTAKAVHAFDLDGLADPKNVLLLKNVFTNPEALRPGKTQTKLTEEIANRFAKLADGMRARGIPADRAAHFLMKLMFCMFAEDIDLLPRDLFTRTVANARTDPARLSKLLQNLFQSMAAGEPFGPEDIARFNGGLFADADTINLLPEEIEELYQAALSDWSSVEPTIFGTLFERTLDPNKRSQIGAHYTGRDDIEMLLRPVLLDPLRREWDAVRATAEKHWLKIQTEARLKQRKSRTDSKARRDFDRCITEFVDRLRHVTVLDPACGSGNFLYAALHLLLDLEKEVLTYGAERGLGMFALIRPTQLRGLEINAYAQQLAEVVVWIGYLQWMHFNGYTAPSDPVLDKFESIRHADAILDRSDPANPKEPDWPEAEFIVGNPPFLGGKMLRMHLGDAYVDDLFKVYGNRLPNFSDLCCYWFEKARMMIESGKVKRAGLLATQAIRGGANREVLKRIIASGSIFFANSDRDWVLDGANVHISMVGFDSGTENQKVLDGQIVSDITPALTAGANIASASRLTEREGQSFIGVQKSGPFDITREQALTMLTDPALAGHVNSDVLRIYWTAIDVVRRPLDMWIIYFSTEIEAQAAMFVMPFEYLRQHVPSDRTAKHFQGYPFWRTWRPRGEMYTALQNLRRFIITPHVSKHRVFAWAEGCICPSNLLIAIAADDDCTFGVLHSRIHEVWSRALGTQLREEESGFRYTPTTCFETFPMPQLTEQQRAAIAAAAKELDDLRRSWLNPPEWTKTETLEFAGSVDGPWRRYVREPNERGIGTVRYPRVVAKDAESAGKLAKRTLTNLYNEMPTWLRNAHHKLDEAVFAAYGWLPDLSNDDLLARLLALNHERAGASAPTLDGDSSDDENQDDGDNNDDLKQRFTKLAAEWKKNRRPAASIVKMADHPAYKEIVSLGKPAVPLLLAELEREPDHWFLALHSLTGASPVPEESRGRLNEMAAAWIRWGKENGFSW